MGTGKWAHYPGCMLAKIGWPGKYCPWCKAKDKSQVSNRDKEMRI